MTAHLEATQRDFDGGGKLQLSIRNADFAALAERLQLKGPLPLATGSLDLDLLSPKAIWTTGLADVTGKLHFWTREGTIPGIDAAALRTQAAEKPFFPLSAAAGGAFAFNQLNLQADFANGTAEMHDARIARRHSDADAFRRHHLSVERAGAFRIAGGNRSCQGGGAAASAVLRRRFMAEPGDLAGADFRQYTPRAMKHVAQKCAAVLRERHA